MTRVFEARFMREGEFALCDLEIGSDSLRVALIHYNGETYILSYEDADVHLNGASIPSRIRGCFSFSWVILTSHGEWNNAVRESGFAFENDAWEFTHFDRMPSYAEAAMFGIDESDGDEVPNASEVSEEKECKTFFSKNYEKYRTYSGLFGYHYHHGERHNNPVDSNPRYRFGIELECEFDSERDRSDFTSRETNWFYCETDGSLDDNGCEVITIPLLAKDAKNIEFWRPLTNVLSKHARSWDTNGRCGLHVHVSKSIFGTNDDKVNESLSRMLVFYYHHLCDTRLDGAVFGRDTIYNQHDGKTEEGKAVSVLGAKVLHNKEVKERVKDTMLSHNRRTRYYAINILNEHTIEFRKGKGSLNPERIAMVVEYCELICKYSKHTPWTQIGYKDFTTYALNNVKNERLQKTLQQYQ